MKTQNSAESILLVVSNEPVIGYPGRRHETQERERTAGNIFSEVGFMLLAAEAVSKDVVIASRNGGFAPFDGDSFYQLDRFEIDPYAHELESQRLYIAERLKRTERLDAVGDPTRFKALLCGGGLGPVVDLAHFDLLGQFVSEIAANGGIIAANGHGQVALARAHKPDGTPLVQGRKVTCTAQAEDQMTLVAQLVEANIGCSLQALLSNVLGGRYSCGDRLFTAHVEEDGNLLTGENATSVKLLCELFKRRITEQ